MRIQHTQDTTKKRIQNRMTTTTKEEEMPEPPVKEGQTLELESEYPGNKGDTIVRVNNFVIIIKKGKMGEKYRVKITRVFDKYAFAYILKRIEDYETEHTI